MATALSDPSLLPREVDPTLPAPVGAWLCAVNHELLGPLDTLVLEGPARFRRGPLIWVPVHARLSHRLGFDHVAELRVRLAGLTVLRVLDAHVDGIGISRCGQLAQLGPEVDEGAFLFQWCAAFLFPIGWQRLPGLAWNGLTEDSAELRLPFRGRSLAAVVRFDPVTRFPASFEAEGPRVRWRAEYGGWQRLGLGLPCPTQICVRMLDDTRPWFEMTVESAETDVAIGGALNLAREAIGTARGVTWPFVSRPQRRRSTALSHDPRAQ